MNASTAILQPLTRLLEPRDASQRAANLLAAIGGPHRLRLASAERLERVGSISADEAKRIEAAFALSTLAMAAEPPPSVLSPAQVARLAAPLSISPVEELWLLTADAGLRPLSRHVVARGGRSYCAIDATDVLRPLVVDGAAGAFLVHNHPSGDVTPSRLDRQLTADLSERARLLGVQLHDHVVVAGDRWASCVGPHAGRVAP